jgi:hypothetical protein
MTRLPNGRKKLSKRMNISKYPVSLYDVLLANEKLSLEMRRQDRELKAVVEGIQGISAQLNSLLEIA